MKPNEELLRDFLQKSSCGFIACRLLRNETGTPTDYQFLSINPVAESILGKNSDELVGSSVASAFNKVIEESEYSWLETLEEVAVHGIAKEVEYFSEILQRWYKILVSLPDEHHITAMFIDVTKETKQIIECLETDYKLRIESRLKELVMEIASTYINLPLESVEPAINKSLAEMAMFVRADRAYIFDFDDHTELCINTFEWCGPKIQPQIDQLQGIPLASDWVISFRQGKPVYIPDIKALPPGLAREVLEPQGIKSLLSIPLMHQSECIGFVGFDSVLHHHDYSESEQQILTIFAQMLVNIQLRKHAEEELINAKERAEENERLKSAFLANMSHEIRTPMNGILGFAQLLKEPGLQSDELQEYISIIEQSGERMLNVINDLINISKIEAGQMDIIISRTNINEQLQYLYTFFKPEAKRKGIKLISTCPLEFENAFVSTDREKLYAVLTNLIKNAHKFTHQGTIRFGYELDGSHIRFFVSDTGIGIEKNKQGEVFGRFVQVDTSFKSNYEGSGLGLAISKAYVELLGGKIWLESKPGEGSTFYFTIPYQQTEKNIYQYLLNNDVDIVQEKKDNIHVLIVDNDRFSRLALVKMVEKICDSYQIAVSGEEAIELCRNSPNITLILMDIKMPGMDGYEATRIIRQFNHSVIIVAQTALTLATDRGKAIKAGCNEYITKPIQPATLSEILQKYFTRH